MDARGSGISVLLARSPCARKRSKTKKALDAKAWMQEAGPAQHLYFCSAKHNRCWDACPCCSLSFVVGASRTEHILDARRRHVKLSRRAYIHHLRADDCGTISDQPFCLQRRRRSLPIKVFLHAQLAGGRGSIETPPTRSQKRAMPTLLHDEFSFLHGTRGLRRATSNPREHSQGKAGSHENSLVL